MVQSSSSPQPIASPQLVGREFVRQYYTMMGDAPQHVYRFYSMESVYAFNGSDPVIGQQAINERIESLNLKDCHAKIRVVDAHQTLNKGVVVQVIGEIAVNGGPLRRFAQTFVLALQSEKKYYVHNDTFRYLDDLFDENVMLTDAETAIQNDVEQAISNNGRATLNGTAHPEEMVHVQQVSQTILYTGQQPLPQRSGVANSTSAIRQEQTPEPSTNYGAQQEWDSQSQASVQQVPIQSYQPGGDTDSSGFDEQRRPESKDSSAPSEEPEEVQREEGPSTWADRVAKTNQGTSFVNTKSNVSPSQAVKNGPPPDSYKGAPTSSIRGIDGNSHGPRSSPLPSSSSTHSGGGGSGRSGQQRYMQGGSGRPSDGVPDNMQVFVGNLPEDVVESELTECFSTCGLVTEVRLRRRTTVTLGNRTPNPSFAFVVLDSAEAVNKILEKRNFNIRGTHNISVEAKRADDKPHRGDDRHRDGDRGGLGGGSRYRNNGPPNSGYRGGRGGGGPGRGGGGGGTRMFTARHPQQQHHGYTPPGGGGSTHAPVPQSKS